MTRMLAVGTAAAVGLSTFNLSAPADVVSDLAASDLTVTFDVSLPLLADGRGACTESVSMGVAARSCWDVNAYDGAPEALLAALVAR
jgi:hypothetical protein